MENGARKSKLYEIASGAVDIDWLPDEGGSFQLIDVCVNLDSAATTSENLTIKSIDGDSNEWLEASENMSLLSSPEDTSIVFRFDKRFLSTDTIAIDFANTDDAAIDVRIRYQIDDNVS